MNDVTPIDLFRRLTELNQIGIALSRQKDITRLLEAILVAAKKINNADGGTLYRMYNDRELRFEIMLTDSLGIAMGGTRQANSLLPGKLYEDDGARTIPWSWPTGAPRSNGQHCGCLHRAGLRLLRHKSFDSKTSYRSQVFSPSAEEPRGRDHGVLQ